MALTLKIIRGNEEIILDEDLNYDFNFQDARIIKGTLKPVSCYITYMILQSTICAYNY